MQLAGSPPPLKRVHWEMEMGAPVILLKIRLVPVMLVASSHIYVSNESDKSV